MPSTDSFPTKRGVARFTDDAIRFDEPVAGYARSLYRWYWRSDVRWRKAVFVSYVLALLFAVGWVVTVIRQGRVLLPSAVLALLVVLRLADYLRGFRSPDHIPLAAIEDVSATRGEKGLTRPRLIVTYTDDGSTHRRRVNLPSLYTVDGDAAFERALEAFEERGFGVE